VAKHKANPWAFDFDFAGVETTLKQGEKSGTNGDGVCLQCGLASIRRPHDEVVHAQGQGPWLDGNLKGGVDAELVAKQGLCVAGGPAAGEVGANERGRQKWKRAEHGEQNAQQAGNPSADVRAVTTPALKAPRSRAG
jgi:hypothetical protein